jgi:hypothetical protein
MRARPGSPLPPGGATGTWEDQAVRTRARKTIQKLRKLFVDPDYIAVLPDGTEVQLLVDPLDHVRLADADSEIIDRPVALKRLTGRQISVVTDDGGMEFLARVNGLNAVAYRGSGARRTQLVEDQCLVILTLSPSSRRLSLRPPSGTRGRLVPMAAGAPPGSRCNHRGHGSLWLQFWLQLR